jgi:hypothetical protein
MGMTLLHLYNEDRHGVAGQSRFTLTRARKWVRVMLRTLHRAIVAAKVRRLQSELMFRAHYGDGEAGAQALTKYPQQPLILGDKWDS